MRADVHSRGGYWKSRTDTVVFKRPSCGRDVEGHGVTRKFVGRSVRGIKSTHAVM
jgi:hypothetical protein